MPTYTTPNNIPKPANGDEMNPLEHWFQDQADAIQAAITKYSPRLATWYTYVASINEGGPFPFAALDKRTAESYGTVGETQTNRGTSTEYLNLLPGVYGISAYYDQGSTLFTGRSFLEIVANGTVISRANGGIGDTMIACSIPDIYFTSANTTIQVRIYKTSGGANAGSVYLRIARRAS